MRFVDSVRKGKVTGPLRRTFILERWSTELQNLREDEVDQNLHDAGKLIYEKLNQIRELIQVAPKTDLSKTTKLRSFVAMTNHLAHGIVNRARVEVSALSSEGGLSQASDLLNVRLAVPAGGTYSPDELMQSIVDGAQLPIRMCIHQVGPLNGVPKFKEVNADALWADLNLGVLYKRVEDLWEDCLWNGYQISVNEKDEELKFCPTESEWPRRITASRARYSNLEINTTAILVNMLIRGDIPNANIAKVKSLGRTGREQKIALDSGSPESDSDVDLVIARLYVQEIFYEEFLQETHAQIGGATVNEVFNAWSLLVQIGRLMQSQLVQASSYDPHPAHVWLPERAPLLQRSALIAAFGKGLTIERGRAAAILDFLIYRGDPQQELWAQPLVPASDSAVLPVLPALTAKPSRLLDVWLRQLDVKLERRGPAFEAYLRDEIRRMIDSSELKAISEIVTQPIVFRPPGGREEEIDVVFRIGKFVVICEAKCILLPTEAEARARHRDTIIGAAKQISRKLAAVQSNKSAFAAQLGKLGVNLPDEFEILPIVITNSAIHAGFPVDGVPIVDRFIINVFFAGRYTDTVMGGGQISNVQSHFIYNTSGEAQFALSEYLKSPPQMKRYVDGLRERWVPVGKLTPADREWNYLAFETILKSNAVEFS